MAAAVAEIGGGGDGDRTEEDPATPSQQRPKCLQAEEERDTVTTNKQKEAEQQQEKKDGKEEEEEETVKWQSWVKGITYVLLWYGSIMMGFFSLYCPALPLLLFSRSLYRRATEVIFVMWETYAVALMEVIYGVKFFLSGDVIRPRERSVILLNHRNRLDWNYFWGALAHATSPPAHNLKIVLKSGIRKFPGLGWIMQMACFLYIHRRWEEDQRLMNNVLGYFRDIDHIFQVLLFPEGTNLTPETKKKSEEFAKKAGLPPLTHLLHPRTTGFTFLIDKMRNSGLLDAVYDVTVAYPKTLPLSELDLIKGKMPEEVHFHIKRHPACSLPGTDEGLRTWLNTVWSEKDQLLRTTLQQGHFPGAGAAAPNPPVHASYLAVLFWTPLTLGMAYLLATWWLVQWWCLAFTVIFTIVSFTTDGIQHFEVWLHKRHLARLKTE